MGRQPKEENRLEKIVEVGTEIVVWSTFITTLIVSIILLTTGTYEMITTGDIKTLTYFGGALISLMLHLLLKQSM